MSEQVLDPELVDEAQRLILQLEPMLEAMQDQTGETLRVTLTVPRAWAEIAAWTILKADLEAEAGKPVVLPRPVRLHLDGGRRGADWERAKAYFMMAIGEALQKDWTALRELAYPSVDHSREVTPPPRGGIVLSEVMDDDIPF